MAHLANLVNLFTAVGGFVLAAAIWLAFRDRSPYVERQARESMNFQATLLLAFFAATILLVALVGFLAWPLLWLAGIILPVVAAARASEGAGWQYPYILRPFAPRASRPPALPGLPPAAPS